MAYIIKNSFRGGIVNASLSARIDLDKYDQSCREMKNFILQPQGGVYRRPGLRFIAEIAADGTPTSASDQPVLIPLIYNSETSYIVALLDEWYKVYVDKAYLDEGPSPFTALQVLTADYAQSADTLYLVQREAEPFKIIRVAVDDFEETILGFASNFPSPPPPTITFSGTTSNITIEYAITANSDEGQESLPVFESVANGQSPLQWSDGSKCVLEWVDFGSGFGSTEAISMEVYEAGPILVMVGQAGKASYSSNGYGWTPSGATQFGTSIIFEVAVNPSTPRFIIVGEGGKGSYSGDGQSWTAIGNMQFGTSVILGIAYSTTSSTFVATGGAGKASYSVNNGLTWTAATNTQVPANKSITSVTVNETGPRFLAVDDDGYALYSDDDGDNWTRKLIYTFFQGRNVQYFPDLNRYYAVGNLTIPSAVGLIHYSTNGGDNWIGMDNPELIDDGITMQGIAYSPSLGIMVAVGSSNTIVFSEDGEFWENAFQEEESVLTYQDVIWFDNLNVFILCGNQGYLATSSDGKFWFKVEEADFYKIYKKSQGIYGYIGTIRGELTFTDYNYDPVITDSIPEVYNPFETENPGVVALFQQRLWFANTASKSQTVFASRVGDFENLNFSPYIRPDDSIENVIYSSRPDGIQWLIPFNQVLKVGTVERSWTLTSSSGGAITPTDIDIKPVLDWGASKVKPVLAGNSLIYVENKGSKLFDIFERQEYLGDTGDNLSVNASELFEGFEIVSMAYQRTPDPIIWCVRSDGKALALTYLKNENLWGWHFHETNGLFKNVVVIPGDVYDEVYFIVYRNSKYLLELLEDKWDGDDTESAKFLDGMITKEDVTPFTIVDGLDHLEGMSVYALVDGEVQGPFTVSSGQITLSSSGNIAHVGLIYTSTLSPLSIEFSTQFKGVSIGRIKGIGEIKLRLKKTKRGKIGPRLDYLDNIEGSDYEKAAEPTEVYTGDVSVAPPNSYNEDGSFYVVQDEPLPMTIEALFINLNMADR
jgi:photosystem II stability/assembly factor-like uncharacterized protein